MTNELSILDSLLDDVFAANCKAPAYTSVPAVDVTENDTAYTLEMDLPGRTENDINLELSRGILSISSKKVEEKDNKQKNEESKFLLRERRNTNFSRSFTLPENVAEDSISASFKNGVLVITMQKKELAAPRKIAIQAA